MNDLQRIAVDLIDLGDRLRPVKPERVEVLAADIDMQGVLQPIVVAPAGERFVLVVGAYRLAAVRELGWAEIPATVVRDLDEAQLRFAEIMENVDRQELTKLERAEFLAELDAVWKRLNPSARHGGDRRSANVRAKREEEAKAADQDAIFALCSDVSETVGLSRRALQIAIEIARKMTPESKKHVRGTRFEDHQGELLALAKLDAEIQAKVCDVLFADEPEASSVADAVFLVRGKEKPAGGKNLMSRLNANWGRMHRNERLLFVRNHKDEILDLARAEGWI
ncbi:ParB/RepB/Spo0J family partition protein [Albimonas sp. CAU 1670]|uniref:ParB/RepB/Spo0J family partition protein n=1 Tax=Albimonas sp. CAU 1670 TaxID=3032599 RepID=UPI0023DC4EB2|nr:ParB/RepB/Spo0J family partition protein [Albimonas sp. CAU 1670]MDF2232202.1 ParB/RepB/Spo0J family partition protein [Albimonas sp. CAU 1670]